MVSVMLYPCIFLCFSVNGSVCLSCVLLVCLMKQFAICFGVVIILSLSVGGGALWD